MRESAVEWMLSYREVSLAGAGGKWRASKMPAVSSSVQGLGKIGGGSCAALWHFQAVDGKSWVLSERVDEQTSEVKVSGGVWTRALLAWGSEEGRK